MNLPIIMLLCREESSVSNMLKIFNKTNKKGEAASATPPRKPPLDKAALCKVIASFPISTNVKYYPEYRREVILDTIILAYQINEDIVFSNADIACDVSNGLIEFKGNAPKDITSFCLLVSSASRGEAELDYERKGILEQSGGFARGNSITLMGKQINGQLPMIDTTVTKYVRFKEGYYNGHQAVALAVKPELLEMTDQRKQQRIEAMIPAMAQSTRNVQGHACTLVDLSDNSVRVACDTTVSAAINTLTGDKLTLTFRLADDELPLVVRGTVLRLDGDCFVLKLEQIARTPNAFEKLHSIDIIEMKVKLLQRLPKR